MNKKSIVLIEVIIIIVLLAIVAFGIVIYITEGLRFNITKINQDKALYMAQTGIMRAIADYEDDDRCSNGTKCWSSAQNVNVENESYYHIGEDANFLWVDASNPLIIQRAKKTLRRIPIKNIHKKNENEENSITITGMLVSWNFEGNIRKVTLGGVAVWSNNPGLPSPADLNINLEIPYTNLEIPSGTSYSSNTHQIWEFSKNIPAGFDITVTFRFSDGSSRKAILAKNQRAGNKEFSIKSTGEVRSGLNVEARRTLVATYDTADTAEITSWEESQDHIIP
ncbi:MAG: hypothetical protein FJZ11_03460 [Candidatus Omnitrophica bacterium]|nr:hypothetical protein [Candidatus Omnitrophota bacterium]